MVATSIFTILAVTMIVIIINDIRHTIDSI